MYVKRDCAAKTCYSIALSLMSSKAVRDYVFMGRSHTNVVCAETSLTVQYFSNGIL